MCGHALRATDENRFRGEAPAAVRAPRCMERGRAI